MKIRGNTGKPTASSVKGSGSAGSASSAGKSSRASGSQTKSSDAVSVSTGGISAALSSHATGRADKVAQIKLEVESGSYDLDAQRTADKLIDSLTDYSLA